MTFTRIGSRFLDLIASSNVSKKYRRYIIASNTYRIAWRWQRRATTKITPYQSYYSRYLSSMYRYSRNSLSSCRLINTAIYLRAYLTLSRRHQKRNRFTDYLASNQLILSVKQSLNGCTISRRN